MNITLYNIINSYNIGRFHSQLNIMFSYSIMIFLKAHAIVLLFRFELFVTGPCQGKVGSEKQTVRNFYNNLKSL